MDHERPFHLEITRVEDFLALIVALRGGVDQATVTTLTDQLNQKSAALTAAVEGASDAQPHP